MSFILDALRKSEAERRQQQTPGTVSATYAPKRKRAARWVPVVVGLLLLNLVVVGIALLRDTPGQATRTATAAAAPPPSSTPALPRGSVRPLAREVAMAEEAAARDVAPQPAARVEPGSASPPPGVADADSAKVALPGGERKGGRIEDSLPTFQQLVIAGTISLPPLRLDMHVYSPDPASRIVFINMGKYREGDRLEEGPTVEEITETGVILSDQGSRFFLDRE